MTSDLPPAPSPESTIVYLVRHAATANNTAVPPRLQGRAADVALSHEGEQQADQAATLLSSVALSAVLTSPLLRAAQTAERIARPHQLPTEHVEALSEVDVGRWEGQSWVEIAAAEPEAYRRFMSEPATFGYPAGENMSQVLHRVQPAFAAIGREYQGKSLVVVGHNVVNRVWLSQVMGVDLQRARSINQDNAGVSIVRLRNESAKLLSLNITAHLWKAKAG